MQSGKILCVGMGQLGCIVATVCVSADPKVAVPDSIEEVYVHDEMARQIFSSGRVILVAAPEGDLHFRATADEFNEIAALLEPLEAGGRRPKPAE